MISYVSGWLLIFGVFAMARRWALRREQPSPFQLEPPEGNLSLQYYEVALRKSINLGNSVFLLIIHERRKAQGLIEYCEMPKEERLWLPHIGYKCEFINNNSFPIFNVSVVVEVAFIQVIEDYTHPGQLVNKVIKAMRQTIKIEKIGSGANSLFTFYACSLSSQKGIITFPENGTFEHVYDGTTRRVTISLPGENFNRYSLECSPIILPRDAPIIARSYEWWKRTGARSHSRRKSGRFGA